MSLTNFIFFNLGFSVSTFLWSTVKPWWERRALRDRGKADDAEWAAFENSDWVVESRAATGDLIVSTPSNGANPFYGARVGFSRGGSVSLSVSGGGGGGGGGSGVATEIPIACRGCTHYRGVVYNGVPLICAMHPYGVEDETCPDFDRPEPPIAPAVEDEFTIPYGGTINTPFDGNPRLSIGVPGETSAESIAPADAEFTSLLGEILDTAANRSPWDSTGDEDAPSE